jgi:hypothetical protein
LDGGKLKNQRNKEDFWQRQEKPLRNTPPPKPPPKPQPLKTKKLPESSFFDQTIISMTNN